MVVREHRNQPLANGGRGSQAMAGPPPNESSPSYLAHVLTERRVGDHLAEEVQVGRHQSHDAAADEHGHVLLVGQGHVLQNGGDIMSEPCAWNDPCSNRGGEPKRCDPYTKYFACDSIIQTSYILFRLNSALT